jgi:hypothetical protein
LTIEPSEMEKFSRFTDQRVGVNPFAQQPWRPSAATMAAGAALLLLRAPLLALVGGAAWLADVLLAPVRRRMNKLEGYGGPS